MPIKSIDPNKIKNEDIAKEIDKAFYGYNSSTGNSLSKLITFIMLFIIYIFFCVYIQSYALRIIIIFGGIILLVVLLQHFVLPSLNEKKWFLNLV